MVVPRILENCNGLLITTLLVAPNLFCQYAPHRSVYLLHLGEKEPIV